MTHLHSQLLLMLRLASAVVCSLLTIVFALCVGNFFAQMFSPPGSMVGSKSSGSLTEAGLSSSMHASRTGAVCVLFVCRSP